MLSQTEENYIKAIYKLSTNGFDTVSTNALAELLGTKPASVTDMIKKLSHKKLIEYEPYKGVKISTKGRTLALSVIRKHRLWEVFLVEKLNFNWDEVHEIAEQLEHIKSPTLVERLDKYLGKPKFDPHGDPIPDENGNFKAANQILIHQSNIGDSGVIVGVKDSSNDFLQYLDRIGLQLGVHVLIKDILTFDTSIELEIGSGKTLLISKDVSKNLYITQND